MDINKELKNYFECYDVDLELEKKICNYYKNDEIDIVLRNEIINENLKIEKQRLSQADISFSNVETLVSFVSLSKQKPESFEKIMMILEKKIKNMVLIFTEKSHSKLEQIREKYKDIKVIKIQIDDPDNFIELYNKLQIEIKQNSFDIDNILIDSTLGYKMISFALHKLSSEQNIKMVNWRQEQFKNSKKFNSEIIIGSDRLRVIDNPKLENYIIFNNINKMLLKGNYLAAAMLYNQINDYEKYSFFRSLSKIFNIYSLINILELKKIINTEILTLRTNIKDIKSKTKGIWESYVFLENMISDEYGEKILSDILNMPSLGIKKRKKEDVYFCKNKLEKYFLARIVCLEYIEKTCVKIENINFILYEMMDRDLEFLRMEKIEGIDNYDKAIIKFEGGELLEEYKNLCLNIYYFNNDEGIPEMIEKKCEYIEDDINILLERIFDFKEDIGKGIDFQNGYLYISKFNIKINEEALLKTGTIAERVIKKIILKFMKTGEEVKSNEIKELLREDEKIRRYDEFENQKNKQDRVNKNYERLKKQWLKSFEANFIKKIDEEYSNVEELKDLPELLIMNKDGIKLNERYL